MNDKKIKCPKCGHANNPSDMDCSGCGITFEIYQMTQKDLQKEKQEQLEKEKLEMERVKCPKCQQPNSPSVEECIKCGIVYSKFFSLQENYEDEEQAKEAWDKFESERKEKQKIEQKRLAALDKRREKERQERLIKKKEEEERLEAERKKKEEQERLEAERRQKEEQERLEAEKKQKEEQERLEAEKKQKDEQERLEAEKKQKEEQERLEAEKKQKEEEERLEAEKNKKAEEERLEAERKQKEKEETIKLQKKQELLDSIKLQPTLKDVLNKYENSRIGINLNTPSKINEAELIAANEDHFSILIPEDEIIYNFPLSNIISIVECVDGIHTENTEDDKTFPVIIRIFHQTE